MKVVLEVKKVAEEAGRPMSQVAINWVRQQQHKAQMIPILGARNLAQLEDNLAVLEWALSPGSLGAWTTPAPSTWVSRMGSWMAIRTSSAPRLTGLTTTGFRFQGKLSN